MTQGVLPRGAPLQGACESPRQQRRLGVGTLGRYAPFALALGLLSACEDPPPPSTSAEPEHAASEATPSTREALLREADQRTLGPDLRRALQAADPALRTLAAEGVAALRDPAAGPLLRHALRDPAPTVRRAAFVGLATLPDPPVEPLVGALAAERDPPTRASATRALAAVPADDALHAAAVALRSADPALRQAACLGVGDRAVAGGEVPLSLRPRLAALLAPPEPGEVRVACAYALARLPPAAPEEAPGAAVALGLAIGDADPDVRVFAYRALGRYPDTALDPLLSGTRDDSWRVQVSAFRALAARATEADAGPRVYAAALDGAFQRLLDEPQGGPVHVFLTATEAAAPLSRATPVYDLAAAMHRRLARAEPSRDLGLAHCAAAVLVDQGRGWPSRVESCGLGEVSPAERARREADLLGGLDGADPQRVARLRRLYEDGTARVREATLLAAAQVVHADAVALVLEGLRSADPGVRAAALQSLVHVAAWAPTRERVPPPLPDEPLQAALAALAAALPPGELETWLTWIEAVSALDARGHLERVRDLATHPNHAVRSAARALLRRWDEALPTLQRSSPGETPAALPPPDARPRVTLRTRRGDVVLQLRPDWAPVTVARFLERIRAGFYDGLTLHRVVPGFAVQGGDPRGDGYGGPGYAQRCETSLALYRRGTVGMALAGRDTGGSQFFITYGRQPHLTGRYPAFAEVVDGMDAVDRLQEGDRILAASPGAPPDIDGDADEAEGDPDAPGPSREVPALDERPQSVTEEARGAGRGR